MTDCARCGGPDADVVLVDRHETICNSCLLIYAYAEAARRNIDNPPIQKFFVDLLNQECSRLLSTPQGQDRLLAAVEVAS